MNEFCFLENLLFPEFSILDHTAQQLLSLQQLSQMPIIHLVFKYNYITMSHFAPFALAPYFPAPSLIFAANIHPAQQFIFSITFHSHT